MPSNRPPSSVPQPLAVQPPPNNPSLEQTTIGTREALMPSDLRGNVAPARDGLRIPSPPPIPGARPASETPPPSSSAPRQRSNTNPGIGKPGEASLHLTPPPPAPKRSEPPSLQTTQVGLGAVRVDAAGRPAQPLSKNQKFLVRPGSQKGELVLTAIPEGAPIPSSVIAVTLVVGRPEDAQALGVYMV